MLGVLSFREFAGATGIFREKVMNLLVVIGILSLAFAAADHFYRLFVALTPMNIVVITAVATSQDRPKGYLQRVRWRSSASCCSGPASGISRT